MIDAVQKTHEANSSTRRWRATLIRFYESLTLNDALQHGELIFVIAGRMERKQYGLELFKAGWAPKLILSVGRFEVSKLSRLNLNGFKDLIALRDQTPPHERHFFLTVDASGMRSEKVRLRRWSTYGEALALRAFLENQDIRRVIIVSTDVHLRRVAFTLSKVFRNTPLEFSFCPVPLPLTPFSKESWWVRSKDRRFVLKEALKLAAYRVILSMPPRVVRFLMRLKKS
jgi:hypothetical protein